MIKLLPFARIARLFIIMVRLSQLPDHLCGVLSTFATKGLLNTYYVLGTWLSTRHTQVCGHAPSIQVHFPCPA